MKANYVRIIVIAVIVIGVGWAFSIVKDAHSTHAGEYNQTPEDYVSENFYESMLSSEFQARSRESFVEFYEDYYSRENVDLQNYMTPKMLIALGSKRIGFENSDKANYRNVANEYFRDNTNNDYLQFEAEIKKAYGINLREYLDNEYLEQLR